MAVAQLTAPVPVSLRIAPRLRRELFRFLAVLAAAVLLLGGALRAGANHGTHNTMVLTGHGYVGGGHTASLFAGGWAYGITGPVDWVDRHGVTHDAGWPACLPALTEVSDIRFGAVPVDGPTNVHWRQVVWVDCRH